jgi:hypothetical protein
VLDAAALAQARRSGAARAQGLGIPFIERARKEEALVESEAFVLAFSPGSTLEPGLKAFR